MNLDKIKSLLFQFIGIFFLIFINKLIYQNYGLAFLGTYNALLIIVQFILIFTDCGISASVTHFISKDINSSLRVKRIMQFSMFFSCFFFIVFTILLTFCFNNEYLLNKFKYLKPEEIYIFYFLSIGMLLGIFRTQFSSIILGFNEVMNYSILNLFHIIVTNSTLALLIYLETTKEVLSFGFFSASIISTLAFILYVMKISSAKNLMPKFSKIILKDIYKFSIFIYFSSLISYFGSFLDRILLTVKLGVNSLSYYNFISNLSQKNELPGNIIISSIYPQLAKFKSYHNDDSIDFIKKWIYLFLTINFFSIPFLFFIGQFLFFFVFSQMPSSMINFTILIMLLYFSNKALNNFLSWYLSSDGDSKVQIYTNTIGLLCFIILSYLINDLNYVSLAIILAISQTIIFIYLLFIYLKSNSLSRLRLHFIIVIIIQLIVCLLVYFFNKLTINSLNNFILNYFIFLSFQIIFSSILLFSQKFRKNIILIYKFFRYE